MTLRLLLVEPDLEEALFVQQVLEDILDGQRFLTWVALETLHATSWANAEATLSAEKIEVVLLNPNLSDCQGFETFRRCREAAPVAAMILLLEAGDAALGVRMVREGAQDFLIRGQIDCDPLAHAIRNAVERQRLMAAEQSVRFLDSLTGLPNQNCFEMFAARDLKLAGKLGTRWMVMLAELRELDRFARTPGEQRRDLILVNTAEMLRETLALDASLYRIGANRFAITAFETGPAGWTQIQTALEKALLKNGIFTGSAIFDPENPSSLEDLVKTAATSMHTSGVARQATCA